MLMDIIIESLMNMDNDTLNYVIESCTEEELELVDEAMEMSKADFKAENENTFRRNDHLKSFRLDNGTGLSSEDLDAIKSRANHHFGVHTLDNPRHTQELRLDVNNLGVITANRAMNAGISPDVANKIAARASAEYIREARKSSNKSADASYREKVYKNMQDVENTFDDEKAFNKLANSYIAWAKRENAKLHAKYAAADVKEKLLQKLSKLKPSDLKNT